MCRSIISLGQIGAPGARNILSASGVTLPPTEATSQSLRDPTNDRYFVPLDKSAEADIEGGLLNMFFEPVDFYFVKSFINHGVDAQLDDLPIIIPSEAERASIISKVGEIIAEQVKIPGMTTDPNWGSWISWSMHCMASKNRK